MTRQGALQRELKQTRPFRSRAQEASISVLRTADVLRRRMSRIIEGYAITLQQYNVLRILRGAHPDPLATLEIGERLIEATPGVTRLLDRLEEKRLVRRERSAEDRRLVHCWITKRGLDLLADMDASVDDADERSLASLSDAQIEALIRILAKIRATAE